MNKHRGHLSYDKIKDSKRWKYLADPLIHRGYHVTTKPIGIFYGLFEFHNESINIWLHLFGCMYFASLFFLWIDFEKQHQIPEWPLLIFVFGISVSLLASVAYHLGQGFDENVFAILCRIDLAGISFCIFGSMFPPIYYTFYCEPNKVFVYLTINTLLSCSTLFFCCLSEEKLREPKMMLIRVISYVSAGAFILVPIIHSEQTHLYISGGNLLLMEFFYLCGAIIYATRFPESIYPGKYDYILSSHQIWHLCVLAASLIHYYGCVRQYSWRINNECPD